MTTIAPYGSWVSPISADVLAKQSGRLGGCAVARGGAVYFTRADPSDGGRVSLWRRGGDADAVELTPGQYVRSAINEYGGGAWAVDTDGDGRPVVVYSSWPSNELRVIAAESDEVLAPGGDWRYGSLFLDAAAGFVLAVREDHHGSDEAINTVVRLRLDGPNDDGGQVLLSGADFYANPTARDGRLAWTQWNHPNMPWDSSTILVAPLDDSSHFEAVSSGCEESAVCPVWAPDGSLIYLSDLSGFWNLCRWDGRQSRPLHHHPFDFAGPRWNPDPAPFTVVDADHIACTWRDDGWMKLGVLTRDEPEWRLTEIAAPGGEHAGIGITGDGRQTCAMVTHTDRPAELWHLTWDGRGGLENADMVTAVEGPALPPGYVSKPQAITYDGQFGPVHAWWYAPTNPDFQAPAGELPPVQVLSHGGPTGFAEPAYGLGIQFLTTRGIGVIDVNYSGSAGYGRAYRERLKGNWGIADVSDCAGAVAALARRGLADPARASIRGGSAGGFTTLAALAFTDVFAAGVSLYGVGDLEALATDTHKYESRYLDGLVAPYPEGRQTYLDRSPVHHVDKLNCPMLLLQGLDDKVVPPAQAYAMADALKAKGLPVQLLVFEGEGHGFRKASSLVATENAALQFLGRVHGFVPAD